MKDEREDMGTKNGFAVALAFEDPKAVGFWHSFWGRPQGYSIAAILLVGVAVAGPLMMGSSPSSRWGTLILAAMIAGVLLWCQFSYGERAWVSLYKGLVPAVLVNPATGVVHQYGKPFLASTQDVRYLVPRFLSGEVDVDVLVPHGGKNYRIDGSISLLYTGSLPDCAWKVGARSFLKGLLSVEEPIVAAATAHSRQVLEGLITLVIGRQDAMVDTRGLVEYLETQGIGGDTKIVAANIMVREVEGPFSLAA